MATGAIGFVRRRGPGGYLRVVRMATPAHHPWIVIARIVGGTVDERNQRRPARSGVANRAVLRGNKVSLRLTDCNSPVVATIAAGITDLTVIESRGQPGESLMAGAAVLRRRHVIRRLVRRMATGTAGGADGAVVKHRWQPARCLVTDTTIRCGREMIRGFVRRVTGRAGRGADGAVIEGRRQPGRGRVARAAIGGGRHMIRRLIRRVAGRAGGRANSAVVEAGRQPAGG